MYMYLQYWSTLKKNKFDDLYINLDKQLVEKNYILKKKKLKFIGANNF